MKDYSGYLSLQQHVSCTHLCHT